MSQVTISSTFTKFDLFFYISFDRSWLGSWRTVIRFCCGAAQFTVHFLALLAFCYLVEIHHLVTIGQPSLILRA